MITIEQAKSLGYREELHSDDYRQNRGKDCYRVFVSGRPKTWKRQPDKVIIPVKHGMYQSEHITETELNFWHLRKDCPLLCHG